MPQNLNLKPVKLPMVLKFGEEPRASMYNNLELLKVELIDHPTRKQMQEVAWQMCKATWADGPDGTNPTNVSEKELSQNLEDVLNFRALPTPMELMGFTFKISGLSTQEVTHLIRHRAGSFAAQCTGDRDLRHDQFVVPESIENSPAFMERYKQLHKDAIQLYADMSDSKKISMMDARYCLPKSHATFYIARFNLKDLFGLIYQRQDVQIQPAADNIFAILMTLEVCKVLPEATTRINFEKPDMHYVKTFRVEENGDFVSKGTNLYWPEPKNDLFEYHPNDSIYQGRREDINGTEPPNREAKFTKIWNDTLEEINLIKKRQDLLVGRE